MKVIEKEKSTTRSHKEIHEMDKNDIFPVVGGCKQRDYIGGHAQMGRFD